MHLSLLSVDPCFLDRLVCLSSHPRRPNNDHQSKMRISHLSTTVLLLLTALTLSKAAELQIETTKEGDCTRRAKKGDTPHMHYQGTLTDGSEFDSSYKRGQPFSFTLGQGMVIQGWDKGLEGICKGEVRNLVIPPHMGYGDQGFPPVIPEKATLKFKVELVGFAGEQQDDEEEL